MKLVDRKRISAPHKQSELTPPTAGKECRASTATALPARNINETQRHAPTEFRERKRGSLPQIRLLRSPAGASKAAVEMSPANAANSGPRQIVPEFSLAISEIQHPIRKTDAPNLTQI